MIIFTCPLKASYNLTKDDILTPLRIASLRYTTVTLHYINHNITQYRKEEYNEYDYDH